MNLEETIEQTSSQINDLTIKIAELHAQLVSIDSQLADSANFNAVELKDRRAQVVSILLQKEQQLTLMQQRLNHFYISLQPTPAVVRGRNEGAIVTSPESSSPPHQMRRTGPGPQSPEVVEGHAISSARMHYIPLPFHQNSPIPIQELHEAPERSLVTAGMPVVTIKPDSEIWTEILPETTPMNGLLHFVNRDDEMKSLLRVHFENYIRRKNVGGPAISFPLMDNLYGTGKTTFARNYLAMVQRFASDTEVRFQSEEERLKHLRGAVDYRGNHGELLLNFFKELKDARYLHVQFYEGQLVANRDYQVFVMLNFALKERQWGFQIPECHRNDPQNAVRSIPGPLFLTLDEIGRAFKEPGSSVQEQRNNFNSFVSRIVEPLIRTPGVYVLLCGRAEFLDEVGMGPGVLNQETSPGILKRINLNPIRSEYIEEILKKTMEGNRSLWQKVEQEWQLNPVEVAQKLYDWTGGNPRFLLTCLSSEKGPNEMKLEQNMIKDVRRACSKFPGAIKKLWENNTRAISSKTTLDLSEVVACDDGKEATLEFLATRIHAGYGLKLQSTLLVITPLVEGVLRSYFLPLTDFLKSYESGGLLIDKARVFEEAVVKLFQSALHNETSSFDSVFGKFWSHGESVLNGRPWSLNIKKRIDGKQILAQSETSNCANTVSINTVAQEFARMLRDRTHDLYFPAPFSASPDIILIPPLGDVIVGIAVKCYAEPKKLGRRMIIEEAEKFAKILGFVRKISGKREAISGVLLVCSTAAFTKDISFQDSNLSMRFPVQFKHMEVVVFDLSEPCKRREFFGLGVPGHDGNAESVRIDNAMIVEKIITYKHNS